MSLVEAPFVRERTTQTSNGSIVSLMIYSPDKFLLPEDGLLPSGAIEYHDGSYLISWTTHWAGAEIQTEIVKLAGKVRRLPPWAEVTGKIGEINGAGIHWGKLGMYAPRVGINTENPPVREAAKLMVTTAVGGKGLEVEVVANLMQGFVDRQKPVVSSPPPPTIGKYQRIGQTIQRFWRHRIRGQ